MRNRDDFKTKGIKVTSHPWVVLCNSNYLQDLITYRASIFIEASHLLRGVSDNNWFTNFKEKIHTK